MALTQVTKEVLHNDQANITILGTITSGNWNASAVGIAYGGTGATTTSGVGGALDNLLPSGEQTGYVLSTSGAGTYSWVAPSAGGATVGQQLTTLRQANTIVSNTSVINLSGISYTPGAGQLRVYVNGVRQFPSAYTETSNVSYTLSANVVSGDTVFTEIDGFSSFNNYANLTYASNIGNISASGLTVQAAIESLETNKATLASPVFTGTPLAPTADAGTNTTQVATTAFVKTAVDNKAVPDFDGTFSDRANNTTYTASTDGFFIVNTTNGGAVYGGFEIYIDGTLRVDQRSPSEGGSGYQSIAFPVKSGQTYRFVMIGGGVSLRRAYWYSIS